MILEIKNMQGEAIRIRYGNKLTQIKGGESIDLIMEKERNYIEFCIARCLMKLTQIKAVLWDLS